MANEFSFSFDAGSLKDGPKGLDRKMNRAMLGTVKYHATGAERHMKHDAPWSDRTTNARNGLFAQGVRLAKNTYALILAHSVTYGVYLELGTRFMRARPIVRPTLVEWSPKVMKTFDKILDRL